MNLNATLYAQTIVFIVLELFTMKLVWPFLIGAIDERRKKIADGLAEKAGITSDDYVLQVMGQYVTGQDDFEQKISSRVHGAKVELLLVSDNSGKKRTVKIDLPLHGTQVPCASGKREPACEMCTCTCVCLSVRACA